MVGGNEYPRTGSGGFESSDSLADLNERTFDFLRLAFCLTRDARFGDVVEKYEMEGRVDVDAIGWGRKCKSGRRVVRGRDMLMMNDGGVVIGKFRIERL